MMGDWDCMISFEIRLLNEFCQNMLHFRKSDSFDNYCDCKSIVHVSADGKVGWKVLACWCFLYLYLCNLVSIVWACAVPSKYPVYHSVATLFSRCALGEKTLGRAKPKKTAPCATLWPPPAWQTWVRIQRPQGMGSVMGLLAFGCHAGCGVFISQQSVTSLK